MMVTSVKYQQMYLFAVVAMDSGAADKKYKRTLLDWFYFSFLITSTHIFKTSEPSYINLAAQTFFCCLLHVLDILEVFLEAETWCCSDEARAPGFLHHLDRLLVLGRVIAVFLSVVQKFAEGLSDRFSSLEHPCVFIHGWYGSFHKTFTPWFAMSLCVNN